MRRGEIVWLETSFCSKGFLSNRKNLPKDSIEFLANIDTVHNNERRKWIFHDLDTTRSNKKKSERSKRLTKLVPLLVVDVPQLTLAASYNPLKIKADTAVSINPKKRDPIFMAKCANDGPNKGSMARVVILAKDRNACGVR